MSDKYKANLNELAKRLTVYEGGKKNLTIAQVKDVLAALGDVFREVGLIKAFIYLVAIYNRAGKNSKN